MRTVTLGKTSSKISEFIFGAGAIGGLGGSPTTLGRGLTREQGLDRLDEARELGITVVDTADVYGGGESERTVGAWYRTRKPRNVLLKTKVGSATRRSPRWPAECCRTVTWIAPSPSRTAALPWPARSITRACTPRRTW